MKLFDLHCDTISECCNKNKSLYDNDLHICLKRADIFEKYIQTFAIFIPDEYRGQSAFEYFKRIKTYYDDQIKENEKTLSENRITPILSVEGGAAIAGKMDNLYYLKDCDVKMMTLTWNGSNEIANGCFAEDTSGLTNFGKDVVKEMEKINMIVDISHLNQAGFYDVASIASKPFIATHSNADLANNKYGKARNLTDDQIKILIDTNGLMGINLVRKFLGYEDQPICEAVYRHIEKILGLGGEKILAIGFDLDGSTIEEDLRGIEKVGRLYEYLLDRGIDKITLDNIFFNNAWNFYETNKLF